MANSSIGTAWIQIKPSMKGVASSLKTELNGVGEAAGTTTSNAFSGKWAVAMGVISGVASQAFSKVSSLVSSSMSDAISRMDILNNFPKVMSNIGIGADESKKAIDLMSDRLTGLPTTLDDAASAVQRFTAKNGDVSKSTDMFLALNDALLAGGMSTEQQATALEQLSQAYSKGKPDMMEWRSLQQAMPAQLRQLSQALGYGAEGVDAMGEALRNGTLPMDEFMDKIIELDKTGVSGFQSFADQAKNAVSGLGTQIQVARTAVTRLVTAVMNNGDVEKELNNFIKSVNSISGKLVAGFVGAFAQVIVALPQLVGTVIQALLGILPSLIDSAVNFATNAILAIFDAISSIADAIPSILEGIFEAINSFLENDGINKLITGWLTMWDKIVNMIPQIAQMIATQAPIIVQKLVDGITKSLPQLIQSIITLADTIITTIMNNLPMILNAGVQILMALLKGIIDNLPLIINGMLQFTNTIIKAIVDNLPLLINAAIQIILALVQGLIENLPLIIDATIQIVMSITNALIDNIDLLINAAMQIIWAIATGLITHLPEIISAGVQIIFALINGIGQMIGSVGSKIGEVKDKILNKIKEIPGQMVEKGKEIIQGLINGIGEKIGAVGEKIGEVSSSILDNVKNFFGIHSPSRLMASMGKYLMQGLENGIDDNVKGVIKSAEIANEKIAGAFGADSTFSAQFSSGNLNEQMAYANNMELAAENDRQAMSSISNFGETTIVINGYNKDPNELAEIISRKVALKQRGVY